MALACAPEPPNPEAPSAAEVESSTVAPPRESVYGVRNPSRLTRGSAPNKSHKNVPGRHRFSSDNQPPKRGRPPGSLNKFSRDIREDLREATALVGRDGKGEYGAVGYFMWLARHRLAPIEHRDHAQLFDREDAATDQVRVLLVFSLPARL